MKRHRNLQRWGVCLPCFFVASTWAGPGRAAPPEEDDGFSFEDGSDDAPAEGDDDGFDFEDGSDDAPADDGEEFVIQPTTEAPSESGEAPADGSETPDDLSDLDDWDDGELSEDSEFTFEDISEDEEALAAELKSGEVQATGATGTVRGVIKNANGEPLPGVYVRAKGTDYVGRTGVDGSYELKLPPGTQDLVVELDLYKTKEVGGVTVVEGEVATQDIELVPMAGVMETYKVEDDLNMEAEGALQEKRKQQTTVNDGIDATEISKSGGGKVSSVAVRIVGATIVDRRYLFVRGLGHRYGNTLLDGARVPSPEPEIRTVPLDVIPSGALSAINVQKTFSPDVPGDFTGGSVQFVTRDAPSDPTLIIGLDAGINTGTTFQPMATNDGFGTADFFAAGNLRRALPNSFPRDIQVGRGVLDPNTGQNRYSAAEVEAQGEALDTRTRIIRSGNAPANFGVKLTGGNSWSFNDAGGKFGILFSGGYKNEHQTNRELVRLFGISDDTLTRPQVDLDSFLTTYYTTYNGLLKLQLDANSNNRFTLTGFYSREAQDESRDMIGTVAGVANQQELSYTRLRYVMRSIATTQLSGRHKIPRANNLEIDYFGSFSQARRDDPALREMVFLRNPMTDDYRINIALGPTGNQLFLGLRDNNENAALNITLPFKQWLGLESKVKGGVWLDAKQREFDVRRYDFVYASGLQSEVPFGRGNVINRDTIGGGVSAGNGGTEPFTLVDRSRPQDNYSAWSRNISGYLMMDLPFVKWFKISGGARVESNIISVRPFDPFEESRGNSPLDDSPIRLVELDWLPSASLIFSPQLPEKGGDMNIRMTGSRTLARPEFRELAPFQFRDYVGGFTKQGFEGLVSTKVWNADLRIEWFPRTAEVVAISGFFKQFDDPIEEVVGASANPVASFANAEGAINGGVEFEFRKALDFMAPKSATRARKILRDFSLGANFAYIYSRVELGRPCYSPERGLPTDGEGNPLPGDWVEREGCRDAYQISTSRSRPLQGQSPWIVNAYLDYDNSESGTNIRVMYNAFGPYIAQVSGLDLPDIYQQPMHMIDVVASQRLLAFRRNEWGDLRNQLRLTLEVENMINTFDRETQGDRRTYETRDGAQVNIGLEWQY